MVSECKHNVFYIDEKAGLISIDEIKAGLILGIGTGLLKCYDCGKSLNFILDDLRAKLEEREKIAIKMDDRLIKTGKDVMKLTENNAELEAKLEAAEEAKRDIAHDRLIAEREYAVVAKQRHELQAQIAILRGTLEATRQAYLNVMQHHVQVDCECDNCKVIKKAAEILSTTPAETAERVQIKWLQDILDNFGVELDIYETGLKDKIKEALEKYRGEQP